jgi:UPF0716 family protein affecting phage T7 exclusion
VARDDRERELQQLLRNASAGVVLFFLGLIVLAAVLTRPMTGESPDTTLLLGLFTTLATSLLILLGFQGTRLFGGNGKNNGE